MKDNTGEYAQMLEAFECEFALARDEGYGIDDLQTKINNKDERLLQDIALLEKLSFGIRNGRIKIMELKETDKKAAGETAVEG